MEFINIRPVGNLDARAMLDVEKGEIYVCSIEGEPPVDIPDEIESINENIVYGVNTLGEEYCNGTTWKYPIKYRYEKESMGIRFEDCEILEYSSRELAEFMCKYMEKEEEIDEVYQDIYKIEDIEIEFYGHKVYIEQNQFNEYYKKSDPNIRIHFSKNKSFKDRCNYIRMIEDFLCFFNFSKKIAEPVIKFAVPDSDTFIIFNMYNKEKYYQKKAVWKRGFKDRYVSTRAVIPEIMQYLLKNPLDTSYYLHTFEVNGMEIQKLFSDTYFVFDKLANKKYGKETNVNEEFEKFKEYVWHIIQTSPEYENVKEYVSNLRNKIMAHGRETGHRAKLEKAANDVFQFIPLRKKVYGINSEALRHIYTLRTEIVHKGAIIQFSNMDTRCLEILQWITYALQIQQMQIEPKKWEEMLDYVFGVG